MNPLARLPRWISLSLLFALGVAFVSAVHEYTQPRIRVNQRRAPLRMLHTVLPASQYDNNLLGTARRIAARAVHGARPPVAYIARRNGEPVAAIFDVVTPDGYNGAIRLLIAIRDSGAIAGVRVVSEHESSGLGDAIETGVSNWILQFTGHGLNNPPTADWNVERDGGAFDQISGATITSRGVVGAIRRVLAYFKAHKRALFANPTATSRSSGK